MPQNSFTYDQKRVKLHVKCLLITCNNQYGQNIKNSKLDIAILTDTLDYIEYDFGVNNGHITKWSAKRIRSLFDPYEIDRQTDVVLQDTVADSDPMYLYLSFLKQHIQFNLRHVSLARMSRRICYYDVKSVFDSKKTDRYYVQLVNRLWEILVQKNKCPWITNESDRQLKMMGDTMKRRKKILRLGMYYIMAKRYLEAATLKSLAKKE